MPSPKFAVANGSGEPITAGPVGLEDGENIFEQAIKLTEARRAAAQQVESESGFCPGIRAIRRRNTNGGND